MLDHLLRLLMVFSALVAAVALLVSPDSDLAFLAFCLAVGFACLPIIRWAASKTDPDEYEW